MFTDESGLSKTEDPEGEQQGLYGIRRVLENGFEINDLFTQAEWTLYVTMSMNGKMWAGETRCFIRTIPLQTSVGSAAVSVLSMRFFAHGVFLGYKQNEKPKNKSAFPTLRFTFVNSKKQSLPVTFSTLHIDKFESNVNETNSYDKYARKLPDVTLKGSFKDVVTRFNELQDARKKARNGDSDDGTYTPDVVSFERTSTWDMYVTSSGGQLDPVAYADSIQGLPGFVAEKDTYDFSGREKSWYIKFRNSQPVDTTLVINTP